MCFGVELTCPMEENIEKWHQSKLRKYDNDLTAVNSICKQLSFISLKSSYIIWLNRFNQDFQSWRLIDYSRKFRHGNLLNSSAHMPEAEKCKKSTLSIDVKQQTKGLRGKPKPQGLAKDSPPEYKDLMAIVQNMIKRVETNLESQRANRNSCERDLEIPIYTPEEWNKLLAKEEFDSIMKLLSES